MEDNDYYDDSDFKILTDKFIGNDHLSITSD
jgi:hypothetical protein